MLFWFPVFYSINVLPTKKKLQFENDAPPVSVIIAAYNEEESIMTTLQSIDKQDYPGEIQVIVVNDGSNDNTKKILDIAGYDWLEVIHLDKNSGKSYALNTALDVSKHDLVVSLDADSYLYHDALSHLVLRLLNDPDNTASVAGAVLVRNSRKNLITKMQEWDYFHGIASIKRLQSLFQGTLVAQGAFSIYKKEVLKDIGGWKHVVGEDIVLTWDILDKGYRVGFAE
ncbi:glycosyltransferase family 2 protein, partial [Candidatus Ulvibacter alkanivorans]|uniref:glycosyltransferase family 2 protein n=1 Tax=Candidatus Ulvibacter alkanivorans TaxID=2267620 RepID=UPI00109CFAE2